MTKRAQNIMLIQVGDHWLNPELVTAVKESSLDEEQTCVWVEGANTIDGAFLIDLPVEECVEILNRSAMHILAQRLLEDVEQGNDHERVSQAE